MAKKVKTDFVEPEKSAAERLAHFEPAPGPAPQAAPDALAPGVPPQQLENAMVQQILERQAIFGF